MKGKVKVVIAAVFAVAVTVGVLLALRNVPAPVWPEKETSALTSVNQSTAAIEDVAEDDWGGTVIYQGETWKLNRGLKTVVFLGIDSQADVKTNEVIGNGGRADTILVLVLNPKARTMQLFQVSRDTVISVDVYNNDRELLFSGDMQINMQYAFGENATRSCYLMKNKISDLLYGVYVDYCCAVTIDGMTKIVDAMGDIPLVLPEDWTDIDPSYTAGSTVRMDSSEVERFVRYRDSSMLGSNDDRMERQAWFVRQLLAEIRRRGGNALTELLEAAGDGIATDMDGETMKEILGYSLEEEFVKLPGETRAGEYHDEYILDETALRSLVLHTFYVKAE